MAGPQRRTPISLPADNGYTKGYDPTLFLQEPSRMSNPRYEPFSFSNDWTLYPPALTETRQGSTSRPQRTVLRLHHTSGFPCAHILVALSHLSGRTFVLPTSSRRKGPKYCGSDVCSKGVQYVSLTGAQDVCSPGFN